MLDILSTTLPPLLLLPIKCRAHSGALSHCENFKGPPEAGYVQT